MKILSASNNLHKVEEIKYALNDLHDIKIISLSYFGIKTNVNENGDTLEKNALKKAKETYDILKIPAISDDTGLFTIALKGEPGVRSARYSGENASDSENCNKLLINLREISEENRKAYFETVICFYINENNIQYFNGICNGKIDFVKKGENGFGYDPVFIPDGFEKSFAEMTNAEKNEISHRAKAMTKFKEYIKLII
ncbi:MAG TPA: RdgB/HAM1 family non-canonical purine NTP pyrophosphatase [Ignavibacteria bacterium]|nr:RdgB/HAM1 family non-canonical purine NTP pyrophosphatase [Ignavibacteria bacterium]